MTDLKFLVLVQVLKGGLVKLIYNDGTSRKMAVANPSHLARLQAGCNGSSGYYIYK